MKIQNDFGSGYATLAAGFMRVVGFFALIIIMSPVHLIHSAFKPEHPFRVPQIFHRLLIRVLGFQVRVHGQMSAEVPTLFVSNHVSYLDIPVLGALIPAAFVAKAEVSSWPLIGTLAKMQNTVFIERRAAKASSHRSHLSERLEKGQSLILFPEGTSSDGMQVLPFKSSLFSVVEKAAAEKIVTVQPLSIACTALDGLPMTRAFRPFYAWYGDMTLVGHLWNVFKFGRFTVDVIFHPPIKADAFPNRKILAAYCQQQVARGIEQCLTGRSLDKADTPQLPALAKTHAIVKT